ncbi:MAG: hypothetical protein ACK4QW_17070 [Alphaproteobacteria bacterium]
MPLSIASCSMPPLPLEAIPERVADALLVVSADAAAEVAWANPAVAAGSGYGAAQLQGRSSRCCTVRRRFEQGLVRGDLNAVFAYTFAFPRRRMRCVLHLRSAREPDEAWIFVKWI